ncbi:helix-turn-helix protein [Natranaerovirga hydrolytica]|uniref:Helix-turn-helix protein n=1 Tax=Natranaerovirga hydrolytica TaxID=680378 RepID=A0A4R1MEN1_9FIRM|nr:helix-turn-helix transcriptional regulator [Natranaerovirga hydrolytica]TCK90597.1 helix-turn-helix protein [Natranaerovirga hydrolytica]
MNKRKLTDFGSNVKARLVELNMTQKELAKRIGTSEVYLSLILYGERSGEKYIKHIKKILNMEE